jgi:hypothetical protein
MHGQQHEALRGLQVLDGAAIYFQDPDKVSREEWRLRGRSLHSCLHLGLVLLPRVMLFTGGSDSQTVNFFMVVADGIVYIHGLSSRRILLLRVFGY